MARKPTQSRWTVTAILCRGLFLLETVLAAVVVGNANAPTFSEFTFTVEPSDTVALRDHPILLNCSAHHDAVKPEIQWIRDDVFVNFEGDDRRHRLDNGSLYFSSVTHSRSHRPDEGIYQCVASVSDLGTIVSRKAKLQVAYLGKDFVAEPQDLRLHLEDIAMLACDIDGAPMPNVRWFKDEREITVDSDSVNYLIHKDGVLEISRVQFADFGQYKCRAENIEQARTSRYATLTQNSDTSTYQGVKPEFVMRPSDRKSIRGETVTFYCGAYGRDHEGNTPTIIWLKEGITIDMAKLDSRFFMVGQGSLQIDNVQEEDVGSYTCRATNQEDSVDAVATLTVLVPPEFKKRPRNLFAHVNADVHFECDVYGIPRPTVQWRKNGDIVIPSDYFQIMDNQNLRILGLVNSDDGLYQCTAENEVGNTQASAQLVILQTDALVPSTPLLTTPKTPHHHNHNHNHHTGSAAVSTSDLPSNPVNLVAAIISTRFITLSWQMPEHTGSSEIIAYSVYWKEEASARERVTNATSLEANVQQLRPATKYKFRVIAYNRAGASKTPAEITVETQPEVHVPGSPTNIRAYATSPTSIKVDWDPPEAHNGPITKYKLYYYPVGATKEIDVDVNGRQHVLDSLQTFTEYSSRVVAYNNNGPGMSTEEVVARTYSDVPDEAPQNVTLETASSTNILVRWEPPPEDSQNGIITGYKIRFKRKGTRRSDTFTTDGNRRVFSLKDLQRGKEYQIRLQALNVNGTSPPTPWLTAETFTHDLDETRVPGQPTSLRVRPLNAAIVVSWTPPAEQNLMVRGYILGYGVRIPDVYKQVFDAKTRYHTMKDPEPSSEYVISLRAYNNIGEGRPIYETVFSREETTPEPMTPIIPPVGLKAIVLSSTTIIVTWSDTTLGRAQRITDNRYYTIKYNPREARKAKHINSTDLNVHIDDLKPNTEYEFSVKVIKGRRQSTWSLSVFNKTFEAAPGTAPRDLTPVAVEGKPTWITLNWQPPRQPNGQIAGYLVFYTTDATQEDRDWVVDNVFGDKLSTIIRELTPETTYYFKVQARNSKGYGPMSPTVIFRTPKIDGTGGGKIDTPNDYGKNHAGDFNINSQESASRSSDNGNGGNGIPPLVLWIVIGCVGGITGIAIIIVSAIVCRRCLTDGGRKRRKGGGYMPTNKKGVPSAVKGGPKDVKPPDLWIHDMELKSLDKGGSGETTTMTVTPIPRNSQEMKEDSPAGDHNPYDSHEEDRYRRPIRAKPIMIPVDQPPPPREPIATAIPNGHLMGSDRDQPRPLYPRTQYNHNTPHTPMYTSTPRVNAGDITQPSSVRPQQQHPTSPYKKPSAPPNNATTPVKPRSPLPVVTPKAPDVTIRSDRSTDSELPKSYSAEELSAEMANLEGLMKDLNAITQQEFEC